MRHAAASARGRLCGWYDAPLSAAGRAQLRVLIERARRDARPDALYTSPLTRARETALALADAWRLPAAAQEAWREIGCGSLDGEPMAAIQRAHPDLWRRNLAQEDEGFAWPGGESYREFRARVIAALDAVAATHPGRRLVIVTHAGVINQAVGAVRGYAAAAWEPWRPHHVTVTELVWGNGERELRGFNQPL